MIADSSIREMARALGRRGGRARAEKLSDGRRSAIAAEGGRAANALRSKSARKKIARNAALARWEGRRATRRIEENARRFITIQDMRAYFK